MARAADAQQLTTVAPSCVAFFRGENYQENIMYNT